MKLRDYQHEAVQFLLERPAAGLFLDMGLGKTASALHALEALTRVEEEPILVVGPIRVIETVWRQEAAQWPALGRLTFALVRGPEDARLTALRSPADIYLVNPEHLRWTLTQFKRCPFSVLVIDESSMFKNPGSERFKTLRWTARRFRYRYLMTGTPSANGLLDLWAQMFILDQGERLGSSYTRFKHRFFRQVDKDGYVWKPRKGAKERIYELIQDITLRLERDLGLPGLVENRVVVPIPDKVRRVYEKVEAEAFAMLDSIGTEISAENALGAMVKCRQVANGVVYADDLIEGRVVKVLHREKIKAAREIVDGTGSPVMLCYGFKHELELLREEFKELDPVVLNEGKAEDIIARWNCGKIPLLLLHPASGGHGLNMQYGGHTLIWFSLTYYEQFAQTVARLNRPGQTKPVINHLLLVPDSVDHMLLDLLRKREMEQDELFNFLKTYRSLKNDHSRRARRCR